MPLVEKGVKMETPIYTRLSEYHKKNRISFAMPGHKNLRGLAPDLQLCDVTELSATVDLHHEDEYVKRANTLLKECYNTYASFIMTGGSTAGIQAMLASVCKPGDTVLASADCHMSVINVCAVCGFKLKLIPMKFNDEFAIPYDIQNFDITDDVKAVIVVSPNYYGMVKNIKLIAEKCHKAGIPLLVDEAHGAHFIADEEFPQDAAALGADMVCQSAHKTLNALTGAAYLHVLSDKININRVKKALSSFQTSSPPYPIAASADVARAALQEMNYKNIIKECEEFKKAISHLTAVKALDSDDKTRIVLCFKEYETTGFDIDDELSERYGIDVEMADYLNVVLIATPWNTHQDFMTLFRALRDICDRLPKRTSEITVKIPPVNKDIIEPSKAWYDDTEIIELSEAAGRCAAQTVTAYPPGITVIYAGAVINDDEIKYITELEKAGAKISGIKDLRIEVVK